MNEILLAIGQAGLCVGITVTPAAVFMAFWNMLQGRARTDRNASGGKSGRLLIEYSLEAKIFLPGQSGKTIGESSGEWRTKQNEN